MLKSILGLELMAMLENISLNSSTAVADLMAVRVLVHQAAERDQIPTSDWLVLIENSFSLERTVRQRI